jgi:hypothetical protein
MAFVRWLTPQMVPARSSRGVDTHTKPSCHWQRRIAATLRNRRAVLDGEMLCLNEAGEPWSATGGSLNDRGASRRRGAATTAPREACRLAWAEEDESAIQTRTTFTLWRAIPLREWCGGPGPAFRGCMGLLAAQGISDVFQLKRLVLCCHLFSSAECRWPTPWGHSDPQVIA